MKQENRRLICFVILAVISLALILTTLFMPLVNIVACASTAEKPVVVNDTFNLIKMTNNNPFWTNLDAFDLYFSADGPIWIANAFILAHYLIIASFAFLFVFAIYEIIVYKKNMLSFKQNVIAKKIGVFSGITTILIFALSLVSFIITNKMAMGYVTFAYSTQGLIIFMLGILTLIFAFISGRKEKEQKESKWKNALGFGLTFILTVFAIVLFFIPQYSKYFLGNGRESVWDVGFFANFVSSGAGFPVGAEYVYGPSQYGMFLSIFVSAFLIVYSLVGFILCLCGRKTDWLSKRIKRWSLTFLIVYMLLYLLEFAIISVTSVTFVIDEFNMILPTFIIAVIIPFLIYVSSNLVSVNRKEKTSK